MTEKEFELAKEIENEIKSYLCDDASLIINKIQELIRSINNRHEKQGYSEGEVQPVSVTENDILKKAEEIIPADLYRDCSGFVTIEDRNKHKRNLLIKGIKIGLELQKQATASL
ncbi:MAG: hypothetical protein PVH88_02075 [Ignavibacteria bacterium]